MGGLGRSVLAIVVTAAIVGLLAFARGAPDRAHGEQAGASAIEIQLSRS